MFLVNGVILLCLTGLVCVGTKIYLYKWETLELSSDGGWDEKMVRTLLVWPRAPSMLSMLVLKALFVVVQVVERKKKNHLGSIILLPNSLLPLPRRQIHLQEITSGWSVFLHTYISSTKTELVREVLKHGINCRSFLSETASRTCYTAISLRGWRHPAAPRVWTAICWLCVPLYKEAMAFFLLMTWGWWFFSLLWTRKAPFCAGSADWGRSVSWWCPDSLCGSVLNDSLTSVSGVYF